MTGNRLRLFIASGFPAPFLARVEEIQGFARARLARSVKWVEPRNVHLTYAFLGSVPESRVPAAERSLETAAAFFTKLEVTPAGLGAFPSLERPRVLWLGLEETPAGTLKGLALKIHEALSAEGFILEHNFSAHITIGRVKSRPDRAALEEIRRMAAGPGGGCVLSSVDLMESRLSSSGPEYEILASRELS